MRFGVMCEMMFKGTAMYTQADQPPFDVGEASANRRGAAGRDPPRARPIDANVYLMPVTHDADGRPGKPNGVFLPVGMFRQNGRFAWGQLYNQPIHAKHNTTAPPAMMDADGVCSVPALPVEEL